MNIQADLFEAVRGYSPKKPTQKEKLLKLFKEQEWVSNYTLNQICFRYGARIWDLQQEGYLFEKRHDGGSEWSWKLIGRI